jgi:hypothetical protein
LQELDAEGAGARGAADVWLGIRRDHVVCYDATGREIGDYVTVVRQAAKAEARAKQAATRAKEAAARARREAAARAEAEERAQREAAAREAEARATPAPRKSVRSVKRQRGKPKRARGRKPKRVCACYVSVCERWGLNRRMSYSPKVMASSCWKEILVPDREIPKPQNVIRHATRGLTEVSAHGQTLFQARRNSARPAPLKASASRLHAAV